ncbi:RDD family protein [uncultured Erythrobacter sp.]|uniref:RDD family protein n=1 Tax=uncultured Erythrobacter sp. TaxID=263913 RepID=UPI00263230BD|nr:RDD family protein [uncultured Erythrobacter sp.]
MNAASTIDPNEKRKRELVTPEGIAVPVTIASRGSRLGALMLDFVILVVAMYIIELIITFVALGTLGSAGPDSDNISGATEFLVVVRFIIGFVMWYGYFLVQELGPRGATLGKRAVGIRVAARGGGRLTPEAIIARNLLRDIEIFYPLIFLFGSLIFSALGFDPGNYFWAALLWFFVFLAFPFFNKDAMRAGDVIAGTWVVEAPRTKLADALSTQGAAVGGSSQVTGARYEFGDAELAVYGEHELQTLERMLREAQPEALAAVHETICRKIGWNPGAGDERAFLEAFYSQLRAKLEGDMRFGVRKADKYS